MEERANEPVHRFVLLTYQNKFCRLLYNFLINYQLFQTITYNSSPRY